MFFLLPAELKELVISYLSRKEYKATVPCKDLLLCKSYLSLENYCKLDVLSLILLSDQEKEGLFIASCRYNNLRLVKWLLKQGVDPSDCSNYAIREASENGYLEIVEILLQDPRVDPSDCNNYAIGLASENGHKEVVEILLRDSRVDPSDDDNYAIAFASMNGHKKVVELLLKDNRVDPSDDDNYAIALASVNGNKDIVEILLRDHRVDPSAIIKVGSSPINQTRLA